MGGGVVSAIHGSGTKQTISERSEGSRGGGGEDDEEEEDVLGFWNSIFWLAAITTLIAVLSEAISSSIQNAANDAGVSGIFLSAILLPIVGNAAEHAGKTINPQLSFVTAIFTYIICQVRSCLLGKVKSI